MGREAPGGCGLGGCAARASGFGSTPDLRSIPSAFGRSPGARASARVPGDDSYLVDSASSHMLVSKIKPCMSKYKQSIR